MEGQRGSGKGRVRHQPQQKMKSGEIEVQWVCARPPCFDIAPEQRSFCTGRIEGTLLMP